MAPSVEKLAETGVFFTVTSLPTVMNVHADFFCARRLRFLFVLFCRVGEHHRKSQAKPLLTSGKAQLERLGVAFDSG